MGQKYLVKRVIAGIDGGSLFAGTVVDASEWRNVDALVAAGRLEPLKDDAAVTAPKAEPKAKAKKVVDATEESQETE